MIVLPLSQDSETSPSLLSPVGPNTDDSHASGPNSADPPDIPNPIPSLNPTDTLDLSHSSHDSPSAPPQPTPITPLLQRSSRLPQPNVHLRDFHVYNTATIAHSPSSSSSGTRHPLSRYLSYAQLSSPYRSFTCNITTLVEPVTYEQAASDPHWREAMAAELIALQ
ncbi:unnamed protein product [Prunus brigantina]